MNYLFIHVFISSELTQAICRTLLHSLWQGLLAAIISAIIIIGTKKTRASIRYNLLSIVFVCFILTSAVTLLNQFNSTIVSKTTSVSQRSSHNDVIAAANNDHWLPALQTDKFYQPVIYYADKYASLISGVWLFFFLIQMVRMSTGLHYANRLRRRQVIAPPHEWQEQLQRLKDSLAIRKVVSLMESGLVKVPVVIGVLKPVVLVPLGMLTQLSPRQVETILLHELAHIRRRDFAINIMQRIAESFFFFNPFIMWLSARIREEREACCDDIVMQHINDKRSYLEALISFREPEILSYGHAMTLTRKNNLLYRVKRMITQENKKLNAMEKLTLIFVLVAATAISFMPAQKEKGKENLSTAAQSKPRELALKQTDEKTPPVKTTREKISVDTLPQKQHVTFKNISRTINDDGTTRNAEVTAKGSDGKTYSYRLENDNIKELSIDGVKVKEDDYGRYKGIIDDIEASWEKATRKSLNDQQQDMAQLLARKVLMNKKLLDVQNDDLLDLKKKQESLLENQKLAELDKLKLMQNQTLFDKMNNLELLDKENGNMDLLKKKMAMQNDQLLIQKEMLAKTDLLDQKKQLMVTQMALGQLKMKNELLAGQDERFHDSNYQLASILAELAEAGVITDKQDVSFSLNNDELIVNGKKQSAELFESLRNKYIKHKKDYFKYKAKQNSRSTDVYVE